MTPKEAETVLQAQPSLIPSLAQEAPYDESKMGDQTWPTDEELHLYEVWRPPTIGFCRTILKKKVMAPLRYVPYQD